MIIVLNYRMNFKEFSNMGQASAGFLKLKGDTKFVDLRPL